jgi:hypothetical protein
MQNLSRDVRRKLTCNIKRIPINRLNSSLHDQSASFSDLCDLGRRVSRTYS